MGKIDKRGDLKEGVVEVCGELNEMISLKKEFLSIQDTGDKVHKRKGKKKASSLLTRYVENLEPKLKGVYYKDFYIEEKEYTSRFTKILAEIFKTRVCRGNFGVVTLNFPENRILGNNVGVLTYYIYDRKTRKYLGKIIRII